MRIVDFAAAQIEQAVQIVKQNYEDERRHVPALPFADSIPDMMQYTKNGLGVAAAVYNNYRVLCHSKCNISQHCQTYCLLSCL
jgi:hypothetical protein